MDWLTYSLASKHFTNDADLNEVNPGLGFERSLSDDARVIGGVYRNSHGRDSAYAGVNYSPLRAGNFRAGADVGAVTGYPLAPVVPVVSPTLSYEDQRSGLGAKLSVLPNPTAPKRSAIGLSLKKWIGSEPEGGMFNALLKRPEEASLAEASPEELLALRDEIDDMLERGWLGWLKE